MPIVFIEGPPALHAGAKKLMVKKISAAVEEAYAIDETMIFLREYSGENVAINGVLRSESPPASGVTKKRKS